MRRLQLLAISTMAGLLAAVCYSQAPATTRSTPTVVPNEVLRNIESQFKFKTQPTSRQQAVELMKRQLPKAIELGEQAEKDYPKASNLHKIRLMMISAAAFLANQTQDELATKQVDEIAGRILDSDAPLEVKVQADFIRLATHLLPQIRAYRQDEANKEIRAFVKRYEKGPAGAMATATAAQFAMALPDPTLGKELIAKLRKEYINDPEGRKFLFGVGAAEGLTFEAKLTRLDGKTLNLPKDLLGKVVVIDFWATWCGPCVAYVPHIKDVYEKYHDKGLEIVGISLDEDRSRLSRFVQEQQMNWIHTFSGKAWQDPTARAHGINAIPAVWVVGKDGKIISTNARPNLEQIVAKALAEPAPTSSPDGEDKPTSRPTRAESASTSAGG